jgi:hypothetical protein
MKALTIYQPWASLIMAGAKPYEFRSWRPPASIIGQRIVIHASAKKVERDDVVHIYRALYFRDASEGFREMAAETCLHGEKAMPILNRFLQPDHDPLPMASGLGTAIIGEPKLGTAIAEEFGVPRANDSDRDEHANWGWPMLDIEIWPAPIPMRGKQGLWNWPTPGDLIGGAA